MFDIPISKMTDKQLRNAVQSLYDEFALFKRKYQDAINNLDSDNFGKSFAIEQNNMKSQIKIAADSIKAMVSEADLKTALEAYSSIEMTSKAIQAIVSKSASLGEAEVIDKIENATDTEKVYVIQDKSDSGEVVSEKYYYYNSISEQWELLSGDSIYTVFNQTAEGFELKGNVVIDGDTVITRNLKLSGNITWDMDNSPVLTRYSSDNTNWHEDIAEGDLYMQMSFDGGKKWSSSTKVVGTDGNNGIDGKDGNDGADGQDGKDGSDANVTPENVFNALTDNGAQQGIFAAFVNNNNQIYINAEYLATAIAKVADTLYIGDYSTYNEKKSIFFSSSANISTEVGGSGAYDAIVINATDFKFSMTADKIMIHESGEQGFVTLADYVASNAGSGGTGGTAIAVFG